ncbi:MAG: hypothetical protein M9898_09115 [Chitinophagaceae bacterium]|nr:hypothetical protein [Chitinophagaceae bacterium]
MISKFADMVKWSLVICLSPLLLLSSCSKKGSDGPGGGDYYFKLNVGGQSYTYTANSYATLSSSGDIYMAGIGGFRDMSVGNKNVASILVGSLSPIGQGTYKGLVYPGTSGNTPAVFFSWIDADGTTFSSLYQDNATNTVQITQLSSASVKGTFSGKIYNALATGSPAIAFTGEFYVKRVN